MSKSKTTKVLNSLAELEETPQYEATLIEKYGNLKDKRKDVESINTKVRKGIDADVQTMKTFRRNKTRFITIAEANKFLQAEYPDAATCVRAYKELQNGNDIQKKVHKYIFDRFGVMQLANWLSDTRKEIQHIAEDEERSFEELKKKTRYPMWESAYDTMQKHKHLHESVDEFCDKIQKKTSSLKVYEEYETLKRVWLNFLSMNVEGDWRGSMASLIAKFVNSLKKRINK